MKGEVQPEGVVFWFGVSLIGYHFLGWLGVGVIFIVASIFTVILQ